ncbi:hypothetical protein B0T20DRAFT_421037 [Sordaria brevicollis]|uniref:Uncharacterized protein n=1 Tax=Sordaria brevicollis TaxID=83679 RepID=A0AAE0P329_SORBR|nr:hypothetical protein B0T20DRAFT_421037 [Sordaria brevicollis]
MDDAFRYTSSPPELDRGALWVTSQAEPYLRGPSASPGLARISADALLQHTWGHPFDDAMFQLDRNTWERFPQFRRSSAEPRPTENPAPSNNARPQRPVIVDGSTGWRDRQRQRSAASTGNNWLQEEMASNIQEERRVRRELRDTLETRIRAVETRIAEARLRLEFLRRRAYLRRGRNMAADEQNTHRIFPVPPWDLWDNSRVVADSTTESIADGHPQLVRRRSIQHIPPLPTQIRGEGQDGRRNQAREQPGADPFEPVNRFGGRRYLPR